MTRPPDLYLPELDGHGVLAASHGRPHRPAVVVLTSATDDEHLVRAAPGEVRAGTAPGRTYPGELTLFRSLGLAIEDLAAAVHAVAVAREHGIGTEVEL